MSLVNALLNYEYIQTAYIVGIIIGIIAPVIGMYIVMRRMSLVVEAVSHTTLAGLSFGLFLNKNFGIVIEPMLMGTIFALLGSIFNKNISKTFVKYKEIAIPIVISLSISLTALFASLAGGFNQDIFSYFFGSIATVSRFDLYLVIVMAIILAIVIKRNYYKLLSVCLDESYARLSGYKVRNVDFIFSIFVALTVVISVKVVGVMLILALIVIPVSSAMRVRDNFKSTMFTAILFSLFSVIIGLSSSYYLNIPSGATIVIVNIIILILTFILKGTSKRYEESN